MTAWDARDEGTGTTTDGTTPGGGPPVGPPEGPGADPGAPARPNTIGGSARFLGHTVQAGEVHGGIHLHHPPPQAPARPVPRQLPPVPAHFIDREPDIDALTALRAGERPLIVVSGPAGVGKTTLVSRWLRTLDEDFPDGQLYADLRGHAPADPPPAHHPDTPATQSEVLGRFLRALGAVSVPDDPTEQMALWRSSTADRRMVVMLDNAFTAAQIRPLLPGGPGCLVTVTSRRMLSGLRLEGAEFHRLDALGTDDGIELLRRTIGNERVESEFPAVREVVTLCAGLPLAVCLASARLASRPRQPVEALARALTPDSERLTALEVEGEATVRKALDASYDVLSEPAALLYRALGALPLRTFDARTAAASCGEGLAWAQRRLDELIEAHLMEETGPDRCRFHDLVRVHAQGRALREDGPIAREETLRRVCEWYLETASAAQRGLTPAQAVLPRTPKLPSPGLPLPFDDDTGALGWLDSHRDGLMAAVRAAHERGWYATAWQLVDACWPLFLRLSHYDLWIPAHEIGRDAARRDGHGAAERQMLNSGAIGLGASGRIDTATEWYEESLRAARAAGDVRDEGQALLGLGFCHRRAGRPDRAAALLERAIVVWDGCGYRRGTALARTTLGEVSLAEGDPAAAMGHFRRARATLLEVDDPHDATRALALLGRARVCSGAYAEGMAELREALDRFTGSGARHWQARTLEMLADSARDGGDGPAAREWYERAVAVYRTTSPDDAERLEAALGGANAPGEPPATSQACRQDGSSESRGSS
ncbi:tetratricopeptide repeat protein [Streptomyces clavuligerus]|uniref:Putative regulator protein n=10 Tax=Streptomyces clavuligerus TaxID=1901 RepID=E2Q792_STRCL|nr:tetratricopeptide repeat protein [Streptomyces clavuligerus]ANW21500.1 regulator [Streptomyces clavuligerus]AXU16134.1 ATP-binding protein [Streptomyces clavuligerus]EFG05339.1 putative regulator protein [Streptomyces clavuligerus]MBY6306276.1 tetratricopeptide repeat protein [Streptomyces clavuligerus]QCS08913.1 ATP-binding protein [Streptomyces clavuligerus]